MREKRFTFDSFVRIIIGLVVAWCMIMLIKRLSSVLLPFVIGLLIAYFLYPLVHFFQHTMRMKSRILAIICTFVVVGLCGFGLYELIVPPLIDEFSKVTDLAVQYLTNGSRTTSLPEAIHRYLVRNIDMQEINQIFSQDNMVKMAKTIMPRLFDLLSQSLDILLGLFASLVTLLYIIFILLDYEAFSSGWLKLVPSKYRSMVTTVWNDTAKSMNKYFRGQGLIAIIVGILSCIGFLIINLPMAIGLGIMVGLCTMIPYMKFVALVPGVIMSLLKAADTGDNVWFILLTMFAVFAVVQVIEDTLLTPKIMGKITGLYPAIILLALSVWGTLLGILGMIVALPITSLIYSYYQNYIANESKKHVSNSFTKAVDRFISKNKAESHDEDKEN